MATSAHDRAHRLVTGLIRDHLEQGNLRLPTIAAMAAGARVSPVIMSAVIKELCQSGLITAVQRQGIQIAASDLPEPPAHIRSAENHKHTPSWKRTREYIVHSIVNGDFRPGSPLPAPKDLVRRLGISHRTLNKALSPLIRTGRIERFGRSWRVPSLPSVSGQSVVLISLEKGDYPWAGFARELDHLDAIENACARCGLRLDSMGFGRLFDELQATGSISAFERRKNAFSITGFIIWSMGTYIPDFGKMIEYLCRLRKPVCFLDECDYYGNLEVSVFRGPVALYSMAMSSRCGEIAGRYLLHKGHREVAFFSQPGTQLIRGAGIRQVFTDAGYTDGVHFHEFPTRPDNEIIDPRVEIGFRFGKSRRYLSPDFDFHLSPKMREMVEQLRLEARDEMAHPGFDRVFEQALENDKVSAWVCYNDSIALRARAFLRKAGIDVPGRISLMGFDDSLEAKLSQLTSYNFNGMAMCHHMISLILENRLTRMKRIPEFDGFVIERTTT